MSDHVGNETEAYAAYLNARYISFDSDEEQRWFNEDLAKAKAELERAWLKAKPVKTS